jgi:hypothetical protein
MFALPPWPAPMSRQVTRSQGLLEVHARVPDPRRNRGRRYCLMFMLTVAVACVLAGAKNFREIGDQARDLPRDVLRRLGCQPSAARRLAGGNKQRELTV